MTNMSHRYGALPLEDERPRELYPLRAVLPGAVAHVEADLKFSSLVRRYYNQSLPSCVAHSTCQALTYLNGRLYHPGYVYRRAGGTGTQGVRTDYALDVVRKMGPIVMKEPYPFPAPEDDDLITPPTIAEGIREFRWLPQDGQSALDDVRTVLSMRIPVLFAFPVYGQRYVDDRVFWDVPISPQSAGWHQICLTYVSDNAELVGSINSWGDGPLYCSTYDEFIRFVNTHQSYGAVITDNITGTETTMPGVDTPHPTPEPLPTPGPEPTPERIKCPYCEQTFKSTRHGDQRRRNHIRREHRRRRGR